MAGKLCWHLIPAGVSLAGAEGLLTMCIYYLVNVTLITPIWRCINADNLELIIPKLMPSHANSGERLETLLILPSHNPRTYNFQNHSAKMQF